MILERIKTELDTPAKVQEAYSIFSSWLFSNFLFFFVIFYAVFMSYRMGSTIGSGSFLTVVLAAMIVLYFARKLFRNLMKRRSVRANHIVFYVLCATNLMLLGWILQTALS